MINTRGSRNKTGVMDEIALTHSPPRQDGLAVGANSSIRNSKPVGPSHMTLADTSSQPLHTRAVLVASDLERWPTTSQRMSRTKESVWERIADAISFSTKRNESESKTSVFHDMDKHTCLCARGSLLGVRLEAVVVGVGHRARRTRGPMCPLLPQERTMNQPRKIPERFICSAPFDPGCDTEGIGQEVISDK